MGTEALMTNCLTIVSGLPRSGTSMMMRMLEQAGMPVLVDHVRLPDDDNPNGYYEFEAVKQTKTDARWLDGSSGRAVKMVYKLLYDLPSDRTYRVIFMTRRLGEVLASQRAMLNRNGVGDGVGDDEMDKLFRAELDKFFHWVERQRHFAILKVDYNRIQDNAREELRRVNEFLGGALDIDAMTDVVDASLYRNRKIEKLESSRTYSFGKL